MKIIPEICEFGKGAEEVLIKYNKKFEKVFEFLKKNDISKFEVGEHEVDGRDVYVSVMERDLKLEEDAKLEAHRKYIDLQMQLGGVMETYGFKNLSDCDSVKIDYNPEKDVIFFNGKAEKYLTLKPGQFIVFTPEFVHAPLIGSGKVKKCVFKVLEG